MIATIIACHMLIAVDGDTISCDGRRYRELGLGTPYVSGVDAPEIGSHARCEREAKLGEAAKEKYDREIHGPDVIIEGYGIFDRWGRELVNIFDGDGNEIGKMMLDQGYDRPWRPHHKNNWCD